MKPTRFVRWTLTAFLVGMLACCGVAVAQTTFGSVVGTVTDPTGAALASATVAITNNATGVTLPASVNGAGEYQVLSVPPGVYTLTVSNTGFTTFKQTTVEVQVAQATRVDVHMQLGTSSQEVTVTSAAPLIQSENAALGQVVEGKAVTDMPLNGRNVMALVGLVPGVVPQGSSGSNLTGQNVFAAGNYQIGGGNANQSTTMVDGAPVNILYSNATELVMSQDSIQEFRVQTNDNTAEYGMYTGGVINMATKSGTNQIHGTVYEFLRNTIFNSTPYFSKHTNNPANYLPNNAFHQNQFGANIGFPILKDRLFGFFDYQGYRQAQQALYNYTVPTKLMRAGNFSELCTVDPATNLCTPATSSGQIYDPCGGTVPGGVGCPNYTGPRTPYPGNIIPQTRWSKVATNLINFPYWAPPNRPGVLQNYVTYASVGGVNNQYTGRVDYAISQKQHLFGRYTQWNSQNIASEPYHNGLIGGDPVAPEAFTTRQAVIGDTYTFTPTLLGNLHISYLRWNYVRTPGTLGYNETQLGFPSYMGTISALNNVTNSTTVPTIALSNPTENNVATGYLFSKNNNYQIAPSITKTLHTHTITIGADLRRYEELYFQNNNPGGVFNFDPYMSSSANNAPGGFPFASFLMGYMQDQAVNASVVQVAPPTYTTLYYQGYYVQDDWNVTPKLTVNIGLRYEIPGEYRERHNLQATFNPTEVNPVLGPLTINGRAITGAYDLVASPQHPESGLHPEHFTDFSPRLGLAYRVNDNTVVRTGWGSFFIPADLIFPESPVQSPLSYITNNPVSTLNSGATPYATLDNPLPTGITPAPGRNSTYQQQLLGGSANAMLQNEPNGVVYQWNFAVQHQLPKAIALEVAYAGSHGSHLPVFNGLNQVDPQYLAQAQADPNCVGPSANLGTKCFLTKVVSNPFNTSQFAQGRQQYSTIESQQLYAPFPQYGGITNPGQYIGFSNYSALEANLEKRFSRGGVLMAAYTFSKLMTNAESFTSWLEPAGAAGYQNMHDLSQEYSLSGYDSRQRLTVAYVYSLPFGTGQKFGSNASGVLGGLISGYGINGTTTLQQGFPLGLTMASNTVGTYSLMGDTRPNVVPGCGRWTTGPTQSRLGGPLSPKTYFNASCYTAPGTFQFGNESREDSTLRGPGIADWDFAFYKDTHLSERLVLQLRVESFNLFNRVQFNAPITQIGNPQVGEITTQVNQPRELQLAGRINF